MTKGRKLTIHALLLEATFWMGYCAYGSFIVTMLTDYGYSSATATGLMTAMAVVSFIAQPITGYLCDNFFPQRWVYVTLTAFAVPLCLLLSGAMASFPLTVGCMFLMTLAAAQVPGLVDSWIVRLQGEYPELNYGLCRGTGSLSYALAAQVMGAITVQYSHHTRMVIGAAVTALSLLVAATLKGGERPQSPRGETAKVRMSGGETFKAVFSNRTYVLLLAVGFMLFLGSSCVGTFLPVLVKDLGGDSSHVGTLFGLIALSEVPGMFLMRAILRRVKAKWVILFGCCFYVIRLTLTCFVPNLGVLLAVQMLQGLSFAVFWPASMNYVNAITEERVRSTSVMTYTSVTLGISGIFGNAIGTFILSATGNVRAVFVFAVASAVMGLGIALLGLARRIWK